jgi:hypothetical protein
MISEVIDWFKGLLGDASEQAAEGASQALDQVGGGAEEALGDFQETGQDLAGGDYGQAVAEEALGGVTDGVTESVTETAQGFQDQAQTFEGAVEDPLGAAGDQVRDRLGGEG